MLIFVLIMQITSESKVRKTLDTHSRMENHTKADDMKGSLWVSTSVIFLWCWWDYGRNYLLH